MTDAETTSPHADSSRNSKPTDPSFSRLDRWTYAALAFVGYIPILLTSPGQVSADTKAYLLLDPSKLLSRAPYMWDAHIDAGTVTHQNIGYLFPLGPWYWTFRTLGSQSDCGSGRFSSSPEQELSGSFENSAFGDQAPLSPHSSTCSAHTRLRTWAELQSSSPHGAHSRG